MVQMETLRSSHAELLGCMSKLELFYSVGDLNKHAIVSNKRKDDWKGVSASGAVHGNGYTTRYRDALTLHGQVWVIYAVHVYEA